MRKLSILSAALLLAACGGDDDGPSSPGGGFNNSSFSTSITGDFARTFSGKAAFGVDPSDDETGFGMVLGIRNDGTGDANNVFFYRRSATIPGVGTHPIADDSEAEIPATTFGAAMVLDAETAGARLCVASEGTVTVTQSSAQRLKGTYEFDAYCVSGGNLEEPELVQVSGSFDAVGVPGN